jgi:hypothetical protein
MATPTETKDFPKDTEPPKSSEESKDFQEHVAENSGTGSQSPQGGRVDSGSLTELFQQMQLQQQQYQQQQQLQQQQFQQQFQRLMQQVLLRVEGGVRPAQPVDPSVVPEPIADLINSRNLSRNVEVSQGPVVPNEGSNIGAEQSVKINIVTNIDFKVDVWENRKIDWISSPWHNKFMLFPKNQQNINPINLFVGDNLSASELEYCKKLSIVPSRQVFDQFRGEELNLKLDDKCRSAVPEFLQADKVNVTDYLDRFWLNIKRYRMQDH